MPQCFKIKINKFLILGVFILVLFFSAKTASAATYYASPTGSGSTCSQSSPCTVQTGISKLTAGATLWLLDGTYTGDSGKIFVNGLSGTAQARITIAALNDGMVNIDGQGARLPVWVFNSNYITVQGINAYNSNNVVCYISSNSGTTGFNEFKRLVCRDGVADTTILSVNAQHDTLVEDSAVFGRGRKVIEDFYSVGNNVFRRVWVRYTGGNATGQPKIGANLNYYTSVNTLWENNIGEWDYLNGDNSNTYGIFTTATNPGPPSQDMYGNMAIVRSSDNYAPALLFLFNYQTSSIFKNNVAYTEQNKIPFIMAGIGTADHNTAITAGTNSSWGGSWTNTNFLEQSTIGSYNLYTNTGPGATIRYRYQNGVLTSTPLWPWPMKDRIKAALNASSYASSPGGSKYVNYDIDAKIG